MGVVFSRPKGMDAMESAEHEKKLTDQEMELKR